MKMGFFEATKRCLSLSEPGSKCIAVTELSEALGRGMLEWDPDFPVEAIGPPGRPVRPTNPANGAVTLRTILWML